MSNDGDGRVTAATAEPAAAGAEQRPAEAPPRATPTHEGETEPSSVKKAPLWAVLLAALVAAAAFFALWSLGKKPHEEREERLASEAKSFDPRPIVDVAKPKPGQSSFDLSLPADVAPFQTTDVYARASGYVKSLGGDVGDRVAAGKLLAEIDTPEIDAEIAKARASVDFARAEVAKDRVDLDLATATLKRFEGFARTGGVTEQQLNEKRAAVEQAKSALGASEASIAVADAEVKRLATLQEFERVAAPFDGVITARGYDLGALVGPSSGKALFRVEKTDVLRVYVNVPQTHAPSVKVGGRATLVVRNFPGREFSGEVTRTASVLDPATRTLRCEIDVPNPDGALFSGMYGEVRLPVATPRAPLLVPTSAPQFGADGTTVWIVEGDRARARKVETGRDFGMEIEVLSGLAPDDLVIRNPGDRLADGLAVRVAERTPAASAASAPPR